MNLHSRACPKRPLLPGDLTDLLRRCRRPRAAFKASPGLVVPFLIAKYDPHRDTLLRAARLAIAMSAQDASYFGIRHFPIKTKGAPTKFVNCRIVNHGGGPSNNFSTTQAKEDTLFGHPFKTRMHARLRDRPGTPARPPARRPAWRTYARMRIRARTRTHAARVRTFC